MAANTTGTNNHKSRASSNLKEPASDTTPPTASAAHSRTNPIWPKPCVCAPPLNSFFSMRDKVAGPRALHAGISDMCISLENRPGVSGDTPVPVRPRLTAAYASSPSRLHRRFWLSTQRRLDALLRNLVLPVDALGVDAQQDVHAVARPLGDLGGWHAGVQPRRQARVPKIIRTPCER